MTELLEKFQKIQLPPHQEKTLGLKPGWQKRVSKETAERVYAAALKHAHALRELEKY